jgi:hypothetical protein
MPQGHLLTDMLNIEARGERHRQSEMCEFCLDYGWYYVQTERRRLVRDSFGKNKMKHIREEIRTPCICRKGGEWVKAKHLGYNEIADMEDD